jgi:hypothetical protein
VGDPAYCVKCGEEIPGDGTEDADWNATCEYCEDHADEDEYWSDEP